MSHHTAMPTLHGGHRRPARPNHAGRPTVNSGGETERARDASARGYVSASPPSEPSAALDSATGRRRWGVSRIASSPHLGPALGALALVVALAALVVTLARGDPDAAGLSKRIVYVSNVSEKDDVDDKEIRANCPARHDARRRRLGRPARQRGA